MALNGMKKIDSDDGFSNGSVHLQSIHPRIEENEMAANNAANKLELQGQKSLSTEDSTKVQVPRTIGLVGGICFIVGTIIGSGIFVSPKGVAVGSGSVAFCLLSWLICGLISLIGAFCYAELGTVVTDSGADYAYLYAAYGSLVAYVHSWVNNILIRPASLATLSLTCGQYLISALFKDNCGAPPETIVKLTAVWVILTLAAVNAYSAKLASKVQIFFTIAKLTAFATIIIGGMVRLAQDSSHSKNLMTGFEGTVTNPGSIAVGFYSGMWAYDGWNTANFITEEIINPTRNLPLSIAIGVPLVIVAYLLTNISYFTVLSIDEMSKSSAVALTWAQEVIPSFAWLIPVFVGMSTFGAGNGTLFSSGRLMFAASRKSHLPEVLSLVHVTKLTPVLSICFTSILGIVFALASNISSLIDFMGFLLWIFYGLTSLSVIVFRYKGKYKDVERPVRVPLIFPIIVLLASLFLVIAPIALNPQKEFLYALAFIAIGLLLYFPFVHLKLQCSCIRKITILCELYMKCLPPEKELKSQ